MIRENEQGIVLYGRDTSYNVQKVLCLLHHLQIDFQHIQTGGRFGGNDSAEFLAMNPMGKVPLLVDGGQSVWESNTILRYVLEQYGNAETRAVGAFERSLYERWMDWAQTCFETAFVGVFWGHYRTPAEQRDSAAIEQARQQCLQCLNTLELQLDNRRYLLGDDFSLADICCGVFLYRLVEIDLVIPLPAQVAAWYERLQQQESYRQWVMRDFSELSGRLNY